MGEGDIPAELVRILLGVWARAVNALTIHVRPVGFKGWLYLSSSPSFGIRSMPKVEMTFLNGE